MTSSGRSGATMPSTSTTEVAEWVSFMQAIGLSAATVRVRTETMTTLLRHADTSNPLNLTRRHVLSFLARPIKPWSKVTYWRCIKAWDQWARDFGYTTDSIVKGIPAPKTPKPVARPIDDDAVRRLLGANLSRRPRAYVLLALYEGLRVHEIAAVRGEDFDHASGWMMVKGKGGETNPLPIHPEITKLADSFPEQGLWFPSPSDPSRPIQAVAVSQTIKNAMVGVGIRATAHQLRDTAGTRLQREGRDLRVTQAFLRHSSVATTQKYLAVSDTAFQAVAQGIRWAA